MRNNQDETQAVVKRALRWLPIAMLTIVCSTSYGLSVSGKVFSDAGNPLSSAKVWIGADSTHNVLSGPDGSFSISDAVSISNFGRVRQPVPLMAIFSRETIGISGARDGLLSLAIVNAEGRTVYAINNVKTATGTIELKSPALEHLSSGFYIARIQQQKNIVIGRFVYEPGRQAMFRAAPQSGYDADNNALSKVQAALPLVNVTHSGYGPQSYQPSQNSEDSVQIILHAAGAVVVFSQPVLSGLTGVFFVKQRPVIGTMGLIAWQPNPATTDGSFIPVSWSAGALTGFTPSSPLSRYQLGMKDSIGSTAVQADGGTVGVYLNSNDLDSSLEWKMMIEPEVDFNKSSGLFVFSKANQMIVVSMDLQIPTAVDQNVGTSNTYANIDLLFTDTVSGTTVSIDPNLFHNHKPLGASTTERLSVDSVTGNILVNSPIMSGTVYTTKLFGSDVYQGAPWTGWKHFRAGITYQQCAAALDSVQKAHPEITNLSVNPATYYFTRFHLNAELHYQTAPAQLGWSMKNAQLIVENQF